MEVTEAKVFNFVFVTEGQQFNFSIMASSKLEAVGLLRRRLGSIIDELDKFESQKKSGNAN